MNEKIALFGAGGKMGVRLAKNLLKSDYRVSHVERDDWLKVFGREEIAESIRRIT